MAGTAQSFVVTAKDAYGNTASGFTGAIQFSSSDLKAGLPESYSFVASDAGRKSFTATLKTAGLQSITVKNAAGTMISTQTGINVSPAAATPSGYQHRRASPRDPASRLWSPHWMHLKRGNGICWKDSGYYFGSKGGKTSYSFSSRDAGGDTELFLEHRWPANSPSCRSSQ